LQEAEKQAELEYQDRIQRLRQLAASLDNLKEMLNLSWKQVQE